MRFLNAIERTVGKLIHVILDDYATHKHPKVMRRLGRHPRFVFHLTPTSCSWLNAVETFFSTLTRRRLKRGVFRSIVDLQERDQPLHRAPQCRAQTLRLDRRSQHPSRSGHPWDSRVSVASMH
jgi:transposase